MDEHSKEILARILLKDINTLTEYDRKFLKARADYLTDTEKELYFTEEKQELPYGELLAKAKENGYKGGRIPREELEKLLQIES